MEKPASLRAAITAAAPELAANPDRLTLYIIEGTVTAAKASLGHKLQYRLNINITDFSGSINRLNVAIINWLQTHQPDILGPGSVPADAYVFEADILNSGSYDIAIVLRLTETIRALVDAAGQIHISHRPAVQHKNDLTWADLPAQIAGAQKP